jgi:replication-associated recombination protein RarA
MSTLFAPQPGLEFPASLTEKYRPQSLADFVGLEKPKRVCAKLAANPFPSAWLFKGSSGTGKTTMALALAAAIPAELHHIPSQDCNLETIQRVRRICQYVPQQGCKMHLVLIDEADQMSMAAQVAMLSILDATNFPPNTIFYPHGECNRQARSAFPVAAAYCGVLKLRHRQGCGGPA